MLRIQYPVTKEGKVEEKLDYMPVDPAWVRFVPDWWSVPSTGAEVPLAGT